MSFIISSKENELSTKMPYVEIDLIMDNGCDMHSLKSTRKIYDEQGLFLKELLKLTIKMYPCG